MSLLHVDMLMSDYLGTTDNTKETELQRICDRAQGVLESFLNRRLEIQEYDQEKHSGDGRTDHFYTKNRPIVSVQDLTVNDVDMVFDMDYYLWLESGKIEFASPISKGYQNIVISYYAGWQGDVLPVLIEADDLPDVLDDAGYRIAHRIWKRSKLGETTEGLKSKSAAGGTTAFMKEIFGPEELAAITRYRAICL